MADAIATIVLLYVWQMESHCGNVLPPYIVYFVADGKTTVADGMATYVEQVAGVISNVAN